VVAPWVVMLLLCFVNNGNGALFSPYKDVTINFNWNSNVLSTDVTGTLSPFLSVAPDGLKVLTWAFATGECGSENWGGIQPSSLVSANVNSFVAANIGYIISTGGEDGSFTCSSVDSMKSFIDTYSSSSLVGIDFDIENSLSSQQLSDLMDSIVGVQQYYPNLRYSFTLATLAASDGSQACLNSLGASVVAAIKASGMQNYLINLMTMDFGGPSKYVCVVGNDGLCDMGLSAIQAAQNLNATFQIPFDQIEITPMIGMNDVSSEVTSLSDVDEMTSWGNQNGISGFHFWSFDRDTPCSLTYASATCSSTSNPVFAYDLEFIQDL